jgi:uncharacterized RDD family membrane protein YckC
MASDPDPTSSAASTAAPDPYAPPRADVDLGRVSMLSGTETPAERGTRLGAALLDGLLILCATLPGIVVMLSGGLANLRTGLLLAAIFGLGLSIVQWILIAARGQTLAKGWLRIRIVKLDGGPCGFLNGVVLRAWVPALIAAGVGMALGLGSGLELLSPQSSLYHPRSQTLPFNPFWLVDALFIFGASRRCLHDLIAGTKVVVA